MTLPRSAGDVLSDHVAFELESIDRLFCNLYVPQLQRAEGIVGFIRGHLGQPIASTAVIAPMSRDFVARLRAFAGAHAILCIGFARGQRKDEVMHEHLARFEAAGRREGVLFIGRAQEKNTAMPSSWRSRISARSLCRPRDYADSIRGEVRSSCSWHVRRLVSLGIIATR
jgi:hypothetical protein